MTRATLVNILLIMADFLYKNIYYQKIDLHCVLIYNIANTPATPLNNAHPGGFFFRNRFIEGVYYEKN